MDKKILDALERTRKNTRSGYTQEEINLITEALKRGYTPHIIAKSGIIKGRSFDSVSRKAEDLRDKMRGAG